MAIVIDYTKGFFEPSPAGETVGDITSSTLDQAQTAVRNKRERLLSDTDWMALSDNTMTPEWASYRQALRDITDQTGFPYSVVWPTKPE